MNTVDRYRRRPGAQATLRTVLIPLNLIPGTGQIQGLLQSCPGQTKPFTVAAQDKGIVLATVHLPTVHLERIECEVSCEKNREYFCTFRVSLLLFVMS
jgi:hypothetical protein